MTIQRESSEHRRNEQEVCDRLAAAWDCQIIRTGTYDEADLLVVKDLRTIGVAEIKCRDMPSTRYETVYLSFHKWMRLTLASMALGVRGVFVVRFHDGIRHINTRQIDARRHEYRLGRDDRVGAPNDREAIILVPIADMTPLPEAEPEPAEDESLDTLWQPEQPEHEVRHAL